MRMMEEDAGGDEGDEGDEGDAGDEGDEVLQAKLWANI